MMKTNEKKNKHLTLQDRLEIQGCLDKGMTFKAIAHLVQKDQTTISKEVKKHIARRPYGNGVELSIKRDTQLWDKPGSRSSHDPVGGK